MVKKLNRFVDFFFFPSFLISYIIRPHLLHRIVWPSWSVLLYNRDLFKVPQKGPGTIKKRRKRVYKKLRATQR